MTQSGNLKFHTPIFRVNNRQENIDFYQNTLGFKLLTEENALAVFTDWSERNSLFVIEESPAYRCRAVEGPKKINKVVIKVSNPLEIEYLLARDDNQAKAIFQGENGYAFETISPENDLILVHAEDDLSTLKTVEYADVEEKKDFKGLIAISITVSILAILFMTVQNKVAKTTPIGEIVTSFNSRVGIWKGAIQMFLVKPILGWGLLGTFEHGSNFIFKDDPTLQNKIISFLIHPHNLWLAFLVGVGVVGLGIYLYVKLSFH